MSWSAGLMVEVLEVFAETQQLADQHADLHARASFAEEKRQRQKRSYPKLVKRRFAEMLRRRELALGGDAWRLRWVAARDPVAMAHPRFQEALARLDAQQRARRNAWQAQNRAARRMRDIEADRTREREKKRRQRARRSIERATVAPELGWIYGARWWSGVDVPRLLCLLGIAGKRRGDEVWAPCPLPGHGLAEQRLFAGAVRVPDRSEGEPVFPPINGKPAQVSGPFMHGPDDDDSSAVTFWGKRDLRDVLRAMLAKLDEHYSRTK